VIDLLCELACSNKQLSHLAGVRIKGNVAMSTDGTTILSIGDFPAGPKVNCFVSGEALKAALKLVPNPVFEQEARSLVIKGEKKSAKAPLLDTESFLFAEDIHPDGDFFEVSNLIEAFKVGFGFSKFDQLRPSISSFYLDGNYLYATDSDVLVRTDCGFGKLFDQIISVPRMLGKLLPNIDKPIVGILLSDKHFSVQFEGAWLMTTSQASEVPLDFNLFFEHFNSNTFIEVSDDTQKEMKSICKSMPAESLLRFSSTGLKSDTENGLKFHIDESFPFECTTRVSFFKKAQPYCTLLGLDKPGLVFTGAGVDGVMGVV
jgi:hypothetical protein